MSEIRYNNEYGTLGQSIGSASVGQVQTFPNLFASAPDFTTLANGDYIKLCVDANTDDFEVMYLTSYTADSVSGTVTRAAEDSANWPAVGHTTSSIWGNNPTTLDFSRLITYSFSWETSNLSTGIVVATVAAGEAITLVGASIPTEWEVGVLPLLATNSPSIPLTVTGTGATSLANASVSIPLTIITSINDTFNYSPMGVNTQTFTVAEGDYTTLVEVIAAMGAAVGAVEGDPFSAFVTPTNGGSGKILLTERFSMSGSTLTEGDGGAATLGFTGNPNDFTGSTASSNDSFVWAGETYQVPFGAYSTAAEVGAAMSAAFDGTQLLGYDMTVSIFGGKILLTPVPGNVSAGNAFATGDPDVLAALGFTNGQEFHGGIAILALGTAPYDGAIVSKEIDNHADTIVDAPLVFPVASGTGGLLLNPFTGSPCNIYLTVSDGYDGPSGATSGTGNLFIVIDEFFPTL